MIREEKKWMNYTYFNREPAFRFDTTHLFSLIKKWIPGMVCVSFPTMTVDLRDPDFVQHWSKSTRYKINRAEKESLVIERGNFLLKDILKLFSITASMKGLRGYVHTHFDHLPRIECSAVFFEGISLAAHIWLIDEEEKRSLLYVNASSHHDDHDDASLVGRAHYFLLWQDGVYLQSQGIETLDLQGYDPRSGDPALKGVYAWKEGTHGQQEVLYHYYPIWFYVLRKFRNMVIR
jgi:hypothetical protein